MRIAGFIYVLDVAIYPCKAKGFFNGMVIRDTRFS